MMWFWMGATPVLSPTTIPYSEPSQPWSGPSYYSTPPYPVLFSGLHPMPAPPPPPTTIPYSKHSVSHGVDLHFSGTPSNPLCCALQLFLTEITFWMESTLLCMIEWTPPTPCATPHNYSLQWTVSTMEWALSLMHSNLLCTIEWNPPYPLCYAPQLFHTANSVNHGVGPLINTLHATLYDWVDFTLPSVLSRANSVNHGVGLLFNGIHPTLYDWVDSTKPPVLRPTTIPYGDQLLNGLYPTLYDWFDSTLPSVLHPTTISYSERSGFSY